MSKELLVLDWNGVISPRRGEYHVDLVDWVIELFDNSQVDVGIWTSATRKNAYPQLRQIFPQHILRFKFIWYRDMAKIDTESPLQYATVKMLDDILLSAGINGSRRYTQENVVIVDDSPTKLRYNPVRSQFIWDDNLDELRMLFD